VSRRNAHARSKLDRLRALPWVVFAQVGVVIARRWRALSAKDRARLARLARASRGRPGNLSAKERAELRSLLRKLDLRAIAAELFALTRRRGRRRRRSRGRK
jgi:transposase